jgi:hypothetical protein
LRIPTHRRRRRQLLLLGSSLNILPLLVPGYEAGLQVGL